MATIFLIVVEHSFAMGQIVAATKFVRWDVWIRTRIIWTKRLFVTPRQRRDLYVRISVSGLGLGSFCLGEEGV